MSFEVNPTGNATSIEQVRRNGTVNSGNGDDFDMAKETGRMYTPNEEISPETQAVADAKAAGTRNTRARNYNAALKEMLALKEAAAALAFAEASVVNAVTGEILSEVSTVAEEAVEPHELKADITETPVTEEVPTHN